MKILFQSYNTCCQNVGGGVNVRINKIFNLMKDRNYEVDFFNPFLTKIVEYDILHVFRLDAENTHLIQCAKRNGLKIILSSIVTIDTGLKINIYRKFINKLPIMTTYKMMVNTIKLCDCIIVETKQEKNYLTKYYGARDEIIKIIPNGVDFVSYDGKEIYDYVSKDKKYVLHVGRFDKNKNQLRVINALKDTKQEIVFIGGADHTSQDYYNQCLEFSSNYSNIHFIGWLEHNSDLLKSAYSNADTFIMPSIHETFGLVVLEAAMYGAKVVLSNTLPILDYDVFKECRTFDPCNELDIKNTVLEVLENERDNDLKNRIKLCFSWERIINEHIKCYKSIL